MIEGIPVEYILDSVLLGSGVAFMLVSSDQDETAEKQLSLLWALTCFVSVIAFTLV